VIRIFISENRKSAEFQVSPEKTLRAIFAIFSKHVGASGVGAVTFSYGGRRLFGDETALELQLGDGDCIQAEINSSSLDSVVSSYHSLNFQVCQCWKLLLKRYSNNTAHSVFSDPGSMPQESEKNFANDH
jgi:hypothetical protein